MSHDPWTQGPSAEYPYGNTPESASLPSNPYQQTSPGFYPQGTPVNPSQQAPLYHHSPMVPVQKPDGGLASKAWMCILAAFLLGVVVTTLSSGAAGTWVIEGILDLLRIGLIITAVVLASKALGRLKQYPTAGRGSAIGALIVSIIMLSLTVFAIISLLAVLGVILSSM